MTLPGAPCIYYGDEIGMEGSMDPDCRRAFPTDPEAWGGEPSAWIADLVALRRANRALRDGELAPLGAQGRSLAFLRRFGSDAFAVVVNTAEEAISWEVPLPFDASAAEVVSLSSAQDDLTVALEQADGIQRLELSVPARHGGVVRLSARS